MLSHTGSPYASSSGTATTDILPMSVGTKRKHITPTRRDEDMVSASARIDRNLPGSYTPSEMVKDAGLRQLVSQCATSRPHLRALGYAFTKLPWASSVLLSDTSIIDYISGLVPVDDSQSPLATLAESLDHYEREDVYRNFEDAMCTFRILGLEEEGAVRPGAHEFGKNFQNFKGTRSVITTHKMYFIYQALDVLCGSIGASCVPRNKLVAKSSTVGDFVKSTFKGAVKSVMEDWYATVNKTVEAILATESDDPQPVPLIDWNRPDVTLPTCRQIKDAVMNLSFVCSNRVDTKSNAADVNAQTVAFSLAYLLEQCNVAGKLSEVELLNLKGDHCGGDVNVARGIWIMHVLAFFVSPIFVLSGGQISKVAKMTSIVHIWELWRQLGNAERPAVLAHTEKQMLAIIFAIIRGADANTCLRSFAQWWATGERSEKKYIPASFWFVTGPSRVYERPARTSTSLATPSQVSYKLDRVSMSPVQQMAALLPAPENTAHLEERPYKRQKRAHEEPPTQTQPDSSRFTPAPGISRIETLGEHVNWLLEEKKGLEQRVQKTESEVVAVRQAKSAGEAQMLARCLALLDGEVERAGVKDLHGVLGALKNFHKRLRSEAARAKQDVEIYRKRAVEAFGKTRESEQKLVRSHSQMKELEKRLEDRNKAEQEMIDRIKTSKSPVKGRQA
ncbi:unnamed protein product [Peniophora sp. CBMAI 1063]|nr:unnamed protein product [Peniophora sp. CBMAI 1063]